ncbi:hypothetical protein KP509_27G010900 [Ceratopteris richardii]|nr:hypothetical protein KP509_27G010900 [Ceratopteris richardii]
MSRDDANETNRVTMANRILDQINGSPKGDAVAFMLSLRQGGDRGIVSPVQDENAHSEDKERAYRQGNWVFSEILILLEAKLREQAIYGAERRGVVSSDDKWKQVAEYCRTKGVQRTKEQCKIKWDNMMPDFRKIRDYEEQRDVGARSYFDLASWERRAKLLPSNMDVEVYHRIANILSNKPSRGLKREAREKRLLDPANVVPPSLVLVRAEGSNGAADLDKDGLFVTSIVGNQDSMSAPRKRRCRKMVETALPEIRVKPEAKIELDKSQDDSSTEDDVTVMSSRAQQGAPVISHPFAERSSFPNQFTDRHALQHQPKVRLENREALPVSFLSLQNGHHNAVPMSERGNSTSPVLEVQEEKGATAHECNGVKNPDILRLIEDRKDVRHKELMALEREKLAAFREASITISNALSSAVAMFSKIAEELLLSRH